MRFFSGKTNPFDSRRIPPRCATRSCSIVAAPAGAVCHDERLSRNERSFSRDLIENQSVSEVMSVFRESTVIIVRSITTPWVSRLRVRLIRRISFSDAGGARSPYPMRLRPGKEGESFHFRVQSSRGACNSSCKHVDEVSRLNTNGSPMYARARGSSAERELGHDISPGRLGEFRKWKRIYLVTYLLRERLNSSRDAGAGARVRNEIHDHVRQSLFIRLRE